MLDADEVEVTVVLLCPDKVEELVIELKDVVCSEPEALVDVVVVELWSLEGL